MATSTEGLQDADVKEGDAGDAANIKKIILDTIYFYGEEKEQELKNSPRALPQCPLFVGNSVRSITFWAQFNKALLQSHARQCLISIGHPSKVADFNIVMYSNRIGVMGFDYDYYPQQGQVDHDLTEWNHYGVVYDGQLLTIYVNGDIDTQIERRYNTAAAKEQINFIGKSNHHGHERPFYGKMKQVRLYAKNLSQAQIKLLMS